MSSKPLLLSHNYFDDAVRFPAHVVSTNLTEVTGSEVYSISDNLRDITRFTVSETNTLARVLVNMGSAKAATMVVLDRGHNLAGKVVRVRTSPDGATWTTQLTATIPASAGGLGSDPNGCLTAEGVWWAMFAAASDVWWCLEVDALGAGVAPVIAGLYLGVAYRLPEYLNAGTAYDYHRKHVVQTNEVSRSGVRVKRGILNYAMVNLDFRVDGSDYAALDVEVSNLLLYNCPWWFVLDDSDSSGAAPLRLFQLPGETDYDPAPDPVHRSVRIELEEVAPINTI